MSEAMDRRVEFSDVEWEELSEVARRLSEERGREVTVPDLVRVAVREYVYRGRQRRKG